MEKKIKPSGVKGELYAPPSKSFAQRAIAIAGMARGDSVISYAGLSDDVEAAVNVVTQLGATVTGDNINLLIKGDLSFPAVPLDCGEAGLSVRMFASIASVFNKPVILTGRGSLLKRPMNVITDSLKAMNVKAGSNNGYLPVTVHGPIKGGEVEIDGSFSSQVLTGILIAAPYAERDMLIRVRDLKSKPYIDITLSVMKSFGVEVINNDYVQFSVRAGQNYKPRAYVVEGDWSGASFLLVAGAIAGEITVNNLNSDSVQADKAILTALKASGSHISLSDNSVKVKKGALQSFSFDATDCPDLFPPLVALAACCKGESRIKGAGRLIHKESNRSETLEQEFSKLGIAVTTKDDYMTVTGGNINGAAVNSHGDHRIAMATAVAGLRAGGEVYIRGAEAVAKSYPDFFSDLEKVTES